MLRSLRINDFLLSNGKLIDINLSYRLFGLPFGEAPIILVNHALTGNAEIAGENGWWNSLIDENLALDTTKFTFLAFNIPGNGQDEREIQDYRNWTVKDIARIFLLGLNKLNINKLHAIIGGSLGGAITWEIAFQSPDLAKYIFPVATDFKASDWLLAQCHVQEQILLNSKNPVEAARYHAMLLYRTPQSMNQRFGNKKNANGLFEIQDWLNYHGKALNQRFTLSSYLLMNHLLTTIEVCKNPAELGRIKSQIHIISVDSDGYFTHQRSTELYQSLKPKKRDTFLHTIHSIHGHDAFLMEYEQLNQIIAHAFQSKLELVKN